MQVHELRLVNFCQYRDRRFAFDPGLNLLLGPNGCGKTNLLRSLQLILTGDGGGDRNKADDICQGIAEDEQSYAGANLSHAGTDMHVRRGLRPNNNRLEVIGGVVKNNVNEINTELWTRLGTTKKQIVDYVFVGQRKIDEMFDQPPAKRAESLAALFGLQHAAAVWKQAGEFITSVEVPTTLLDRDELQRKLVQNVQTTNQLADRIQRLGLPLDVQGYRQHHQQVVEGYDTWVRVRDAAIAAREAVEPVRQAVANAATAMDALNEDLQLLQRAADADRDEAGRVRQQLQQWKVYRDNSLARRRAVAEQTAFQAKPAPKQPVPPPMPDLTEVEHATLDALTARQREIDSAIKMIKAAPQRCDVCGQAMPSRGENLLRLTQLEAEQKVRAEEIVPLVARLNAWMYYDSDCVDYERWQEQKKLIDAMMAGLKSSDPPETPEPELQEYINEYNEVLAALSRLQEERLAKVNELARLEGELAQLQRAAAAAANAADSTRDYTPAQAEQSRRALADLEERLTSRHLLEIQREQASAEHRHLQQQLEEYERIGARALRTRAAIADLTAVRQIFHHDEAPRMVSYTYIENMLEEVNDTLEIFEAPYRVVMDENLGFIANFNDGVRRQPDRRLSIGERIVLAMAFRVTVNATFAGQVGMLVLDEPTAGLDEHNLGCLPNALMRLKELSEQRGLQVFFVTHEPRITGMFDNVIELSAVSL